MPNQNLALKLVRMKCSDETGSNRWTEAAGHDQIWLSAIAVDGAGNLKKVEPFEIHPHFDDGDTHVFTPERVLVDLNVPENGRFPKPCKVAFVLAEWADGKGHREVTDQLFAKAAEQASSKADVWGPVVVVLKDLLTEWLKTRLAGKDKIFPLMEASLDVASPDFRWGDGTKLSPETTVNFRAHDASYFLTYFWEIRAA